MAIVLLFNLFLLSVVPGTESCSLRRTHYVSVPEKVEPGAYITTAYDTDCVSGSTHLTVSDPAFTVSPDGVVKAAQAVRVGAAGRTFSVFSGASGGPGSEMVVHLVHSTRVKRKPPTGVLQRSKRRWSPPPFNILENDIGPFPKKIEIITSDSSVNFTLYYVISGPGVDRDPVGLFSIDRTTGMLSVHRSIDREQYPTFKILTTSYDVKTNQITDEPLDILIHVDDVNDNKPTFTDKLQFSVPEQSRPGTVVGKVNATDRDEAGTKHVEIRYTLLTGTNLFTINAVTGVITTATNSLDREDKDKHFAVVKITDMAGEAGGLFNTATATITVGDINDNPPTFTKTSLTAQVKENVKDQLILRIPVNDKDQKDTANWKSKFLITKGNETGNFRIDVDPKTNEGLLYVMKPLDHERTKTVDLTVEAQNEAELVGTSQRWQTANVVVTVTNEDEGPEFTAPTVRYNVKENTPNGTVVGKYIAIDPETRKSDGIKYYKVSEPASWFTVDQSTGELRVANTIDRESHFVKDGLYTFTVKAIDATAKTGTGTVIIMVEDVNDHMPIIPPSELVMCEKEGELRSVLVVAHDNDQNPFFTSPFGFSVPSDYGDKWEVTKFNDTTATLRQRIELPTGIYEVPVEVLDLQGYGKTQTATVKICRCRNDVCLDSESSVTLGPLGWLALLLPLLLLLLLALLLGFFCATKREKIDFIDGGNSGGILLKSNTEAPGEEVDSSLIYPPTTTIEQGWKGAEVTSGVTSGVNTGWMATNSFGTMGGKSVHDNGMYHNEVGTLDVSKCYSGQYNQYGGTLGSAHNFDSSRFQTMDSQAYMHNWNTNGRYLQQKLVYFGNEEDGRYADDIVHAYGFEGVGSAAGSVGCCSDFGDNDNLDFLNSLGPKFKKLGETCRKT